jgi:hypothetical protein
MRMLMGAACLILASAAGTPTLAQDAPAHGGGYQCTIGITDVRTGDVSTLTASLGSPDACKGWGADTNHLNARSFHYDLLVHDQAGKLVLKQSCAPKGIALLGSSHTVFVCKDVS